MRGRCGREARREGGGMRWMKEQGVGESRVGRRDDEQEWGEGMGKRVSKKV